ncbi:hypothetical protein N9934_05125, partial [Desulfosarcina sp.]|nr:hypothetical protein [Desulfosarcina sp.]
MASRKKMKRYPVQRHISVVSPSPAPANSYVDVPAVLSQTNHRLYRQGRVYECSVTIDSNVADNTSVDVYALADSWMVQKAWQMAKSVYDMAMVEEKEMLNGRIARWNDFRVLNGLSGFGGLNAVNFLKRTLASTPLTVGEFETSIVKDQAGTVKAFSWGDPNSTTYSIIEEYDASGNTDVDPTNPATGAYNGLLPNLDATAAESLQADGNNPPYDANDIGQAIWVKVGTLHLSAGRQRLSTGFFPAPCGIIAMT